MIPTMKWIMILLLTLGCGSLAEEPPPPVLSPTPQASLTAPPPVQDVPEEALLLDALAEHHKEAVRLLQDAQRRRRGGELRRLARALAQPRVAELRQLEAWRQAWYPDAPRLRPEELTRRMGLEGLMPRPPLDALVREDQGLLQELRPHHEEAVGLAEMAVERADHEELRDLAERMIQARRQELERIEEARARLEAASG